MKKIALVELQEHQGVLFGLIDLLVIQKMEIYVFAPAYMEQQLEDKWKTLPQLKWFSKRKGESNPAFFERNQTSVYSCDLILFVTLVRDFQFFSRKNYPCPTVLLIHKGNFFFAPHRNLSIQSFKDILRLLRNFVTREHYFRRKLLKKVDFCAFLAPEIQRFMQPNLPAGGNFLPALSYAYWEPCPLPAGRILSIVIPGTVSGLKRDFDLLLEALTVADQALNQPVELIFLGNSGTARAKPLFDQLNQLQFQNIRIQYFQQLVPENEYNRILQLADFLVIPLQEVLYFGLIREYYGKTSISACVYELLRFGKPALLPAFYPLEPALDALTLRYNHAEELANLLIDWVNNGTYRELAARAPQQLQAYSKAQTSKRLMEILHSV